MIFDFQYLLEKNSFKEHRIHVDNEGRMSISPFDQEKVPFSFGSDLNAENSIALEGEQISTISYLNLGWLLL